MKSCWSSDKKKFLVLQMVELEDIIRSANDYLVIDGQKDGEKYTRVVGFIDEKNYKKSFYCDTNGKPIFISEISHWVPDKYKEDIKRIVRENGFTGKVYFESPDF